MLSPQARGKATGRHSVTTDFSIARSIGGCDCWWWWRSLLIIYCSCNVAFTSHRITTCRCGQHCLLSVLNGTGFCCCAVTGWLLIGATSCHSDWKVTFHSVYRCTLGPTFYWAKQAAVRVITGLGASHRGRLRHAICSKHWWLQVMIHVDSSRWLLDRLWHAKNVTATSTWGLQDLARIPVAACQSNAEACWCHFLRAVIFHHTHKFLASITVNLQTTNPRWAVNA